MVTTRTTSRGIGVRTLELLEAVDVLGSVGVSELARHLNVDKGNLSRQVASLVDDGWLIRADGRLGLGIRSIMLGRSHPIATAITRLEPALDAAAGVTGFPVHVTALVGNRPVVLAMAGRQDASLAPTGAPMSVLPLWAGSAGKVIAAQMTSDEIEALLPPEPFEGHAPLIDRWLPSSSYEDMADAPSGRAYGTTMVHTVGELHDQLAQIRRDGWFLERNELVEGMGCLSVSWAVHGLVATIGVIGGLPRMVEECGWLREVLGVLARPGASRQDVITCAARQVKQTEPNPLAPGLTADADRLTFDRR